MNEKLTFTHFSRNAEQCLICNTEKRSGRVVVTSTAHDFELVYCAKCIHRLYLNVPLKPRRL